MTSARMFNYFFLDSNTNYQYYIIKQAKKTQLHSPVISVLNHDLDLVQITLSKVNNTISGHE